MRFLIVLILSLLSFPASAQDDQSFGDLMGIPQMEGLDEKLDARLVFDKPEGRIIHAELFGTAPESQARAFYQETLFQLGWTLEGEKSEGFQTTLLFVREGEQLRLIFEENYTLLLTFELGPATEAQG